MIGSIIAWVGKHKLLAFLGAAGVGALVVKNVTPAVNPVLPGAHPSILPVPGGGLVNTATNQIIPAPNAQVTVNQVYVITTTDPAPNGNLNARATGDFASGQPSGAKIGYWPKNGTVELLDPGSGNGMVLVSGPGFDGNGTAQVALQGWAYSGYLVAQKPVQIT